MSGNLVLNVGYLPNHYFKPIIEKVCGETTKFYIVANAGGTRKLLKEHCIPFTPENQCLCEEAVELHKKWWAIQLELKEKNNPLTLGG